MVRKGDRSMVMEDRCAQSRSTMKKVQLQLGLVDENATDAEFRRYDHDQRVVQSLLNRLHSYYLIKAFERFGLFIEHDLAIIHSMLTAPHARRADSPATRDRFRKSAHIP